MTTCLPCHLRGKKRAPGEPVKTPSKTAASHRPIGQNSNAIRQIGALAGSLRPRRVAGSGMTVVGRSMVSRWFVPPAAHPYDVVKGGFEQGEIKTTMGDQDLERRDPKGCAGIRDPETECRSIPGQTPNRVPCNEKRRKNDKAS